MPSQPARRPVEVILALVLLIAGWAWIGIQHQALWLRLPDIAMERYVADQTSAPIDTPISVDSLQPLCTDAPSRLAGLWPRRARDQLAACLYDDARLTGDASARDTLALYDARLVHQMEQARGWLQAFEAEAPDHRAELLAALARIRSKTGDSLLKPLLPALQQREAIDPPLTSTALNAAIASDLRARLARAEETHRKVLGSASPAAQKARELGLLITGKRIALDYSDAPPSAHFATDRTSLAESLEWLRRGQGYAQRGFKLETLHGVPMAIGGAALLTVLAALVAGNALLPWVLGGQLLGVGAVVLSDIALTGAPALRYLADRQFIRMGLGETSLPLMGYVPLGNVQAALWLPLILVAVLVLLLGTLRTGQSLAAWPIRQWVRWANNGHSTHFQALGLVLLASTCVLLLGMPAAISELLILLGCIGVAGYLARQAPHANAGAGLQRHSMLVVSAALVLAVGGAVLRSDLGHALVATAMACAFFWLFGGLTLRIALAGLFAGGVFALTWSHITGQVDGPLGVLATILPTHANERLEAMLDPWHATSSDLARARWLIESARDGGWGPGLVPWQGLMADGAQAGLPLQGPSDYVLSLVVAEWGLAGGFTLLTLTLYIFASAAFLGLRSALHPGMPAVARWLTAIGGFGCLVMTAKALLSMAGVAGLLPLTGLPVALLGYGAVGNFAALLYLTLALGCRRVDIQETPGVVTRAKNAQQGAVRLRSTLLAGAGLGVLGTSLAAGIILLTSEDSPTNHQARQRFELAQAVAAALVSSPTTSTGLLPCAELGFAVAAWNSRLAGLPAPRRYLDAQRLLASDAAGTDCRRLAGKLGGMLHHELSALLAFQEVSGSSPMVRVRQDAPGPHRPQADPRNYNTANAFRSLPGCLRTDTTDADCTPGAAPIPDHTDPWLRQELAPRLQAALREPTRTRPINGRSTPIGPELSLSLAPDIQALAQQIADCQTGLRRGDDCRPVAPRDETARRRFESSNALRAGALGIVVTEVDSGRIVALAGALSDCSLEALGRKAEADANKRTAAVTGQAPCAQLPDRRSNWLLTRSPALWMVPPGSALKELGLAAAIDRGLIPVSEDARWKGILAESHDNESVQRITLASGPRYLELLAAAGFGAPAQDILWGGAHTGTTRWLIDAHEGQRGLKPAEMDFDTLKRIRRDKEAGVDIDRLHGHTQVTRYLAARRLADSVVGGADLRISALGLADTWRRLELRARGKDSAPALHLVHQVGKPPAMITLGNLAPSSAVRAMALTTGVTASAWKGTAQGSCRVVFGQCPADGILDLAGKTGTADFLDGEDSPWVKPGLQLPAKLFGGVFTVGGKRYSVGVMALRVREAGTRSLELQSSAPAEAALTLIRQLREANAKASGPKPAPI